MQAFSSEEILKSHIKYCFKINGKQTIKMSKNGKYIKFKNLEGKIKSPFKIYAEFESILVPEHNGKQNPNESQTKKYQKHVGCSYGYKLVHVNDKFSKPFKSYLGKGAIYNFIRSIIKESKNCSDVMKSHFSKKLVMTKEGNEDFENSTKCWICYNDYIDADVKVRDHRHITGKYRVSAQRDFNIYVKLNHKIPLVFQYLKIMIHILLCNNQTNSILIYVIPNGLDKYMKFTIKNKLKFY